MKKIAALLTVIFILTLTAGCSGDRAEKTEKTAAELMETVVSSIEFPPMVDLTDEQRIADMGIDISAAEEYAIKQQMLSVDVVEVIIIIAKEGEVSNIEAVLEKRRESLINDFACYPEQVESTQATVVGSRKNVCYLICHAEAGTAEKALIDAI